MKKINLFNIIFFLFFPFFIFSQSQEILINYTKPKIKKISSKLQLPATIRSNEKVNITSTVSEKIDRILFKEGIKVKKGQVLVTLNKAEEDAILKQFEAELNEAEINYNRALKLSENGNISQSILENRLTQKEKLSGKVQEIKAKINEHILIAPFNGIIGVRNYSEGSFIKPGDIITTIYDNSFLKIEAFAPETHINKIKVGDKVNINIKTHSSNLRGEIYVVDPFIDIETRSFKLLSIMENNNEIKPGMMAKVTIDLEKKSSIVIPESSIIPIDNETFVYIVNKQNIIEKRRVYTGIRNDGEVEIIKGVSLNDKVVYEGINKIKDGIKVSTK